MRPVVTFNRSQLGSLLTAEKAETRRLRAKVEDLEMQIDEYERRSLEPQTDSKSTLILGRMMIGWALMVLIVVALIILL